MPTRYTANYRLNQWELEDKVLRTDFNDDNARIDAALTALAGQTAKKAEQSALNTLSATVSGQAAQLATRGNCKIETFSYVGTGKSGSDAAIELTFSARPVLFLIVGERNAVISAGMGTNNVYVGPVYVSQQGSSFKCFNVSMKWSGNQVSISVPSDINSLNNADQAYQVVALIAADA